MSELEFTKFEQVNLKNHPLYNEKWVQEKIADDPSILGLGDLILLNEELIQSGGGRLDLLHRSFSPPTGRAGMGVPTYM